MGQSEREQRLKRALAPIRDEYDYILIDCPPALSLLTLNALAAADSVIVPMQCEYYALEGLSALVETIEALRTSLNPALERRRAAHHVRRAQQPGQCGLGRAHRALRRPRFPTIVPRNVRLAEASHGQSIASATTAPRAVAWPGPGRRDHPPQQRNATRPARPWRPSDDQQQAGGQKRGLGRGLDAAGPKGAVSQVQATTAVIEPLPGEVLRKLPVGQLQPGKYQPRH